MNGSLISPIATLSFCSVNTIRDTKRPMRPKPLTPIVECVLLEEDMTEIIVLEKLCRSVFHGCESRWRDSSSLSSNNRTTTTDI
jgi:hypothetical protein